jgi:hypothetical protein
MAAAELIPTGTGAANSADIEVTIDAPITVCLKDAAAPDLPGDCQVDITIKDDDGQYFQIGSLTNDSVQSRALVLTGPGTYRLSRTADSQSCGAFSA